MCRQSMKAPIGAVMSVVMMPPTKAIIIMVKAEVVDPGGKKLYTPDTSIPDEEVPAGDASLPALSNVQ